MKEQAAAPPAAGAARGGQRRGAGAYDTIGDPHRQEASTVTRRLLILVVLAAALAAASVLATPASAQAINFSGTTDGCFGAACVAGNTATTGGLTYNDSTFSGTTSDGFLAIGAFTFGHLRIWGAPFLVALLGAGLLAAVAGVLVGFPSLRLKGPYLSIATLGFGIAVYQVFVNYETLSGGRSGVLRISW